MKRIVMFDAKPYDRESFDSLKDQYDFRIKYFENKLNPDTAALAQGADAVIAFVNDTIDAQVIEKLNSFGIKILALRCAGFNNVDFTAAYGKLHIVHVPAYSPYAVAEHAMALLLTLNRKIHRAFNRTREFNFSINGLTGYDLHGKTIGIIGTGKIGRIFIDICRGFGMRVLAYDLYPAENSDIKYVSLEELLKKSDIISLHCPLTKETHHIIDEKAFKLAKDGVVLINTSRGALIDSHALTEALKNGKVGAAGLDVYEEESEVFFEDFSSIVIQDDILARLVTMPNVIVTSHQAFLTREALANIARTTLDNLHLYFIEGDLPNEICYQCKTRPNCDRTHNRPCF